MNEAACPPAVRQEPDSMLNLLDVDFWLWYQKVTPKGMARAFRIRFWETFNTPGMYDILTDNQYKLPKSNDGCMQLLSPQLHVPNGTKGWMRMKKSSTGSAKMLGSPLSVSQR